eukprot:CAMPEP_0118636400 /NCGR_PEP_ID=MMETSP0785-20121206/2600_1 /TAXON_ID=91992 /ORGANISM="Bolidomonas pacifica, Strain CCMP 1866" /LENGTH=36 /DNA_ID= /DNA_START= /DNA_END= /DNA_ORIENTATION=
MMLALAYRKAALALSWIRANMSPMIAISKLRRTTLT